jgi:hypothetical protein
MVRIEDSLFDAALRLVANYVRMVPYDGEARQRLAELMAARSRDPRDLLSTWHSTTPRRAGRRHRSWRRPDGRGNLGSDRPVRHGHQLCRRHGGLRLNSWPWTSYSPRTRLSSSDWHAMIKCRRCGAGPVMAVKVACRLARNARIPGACSGPTADRIRTHRTGRGRPKLQSPER